MIPASLRYHGDLGAGLAFSSCDLPAKAPRLLLLLSEAGRSEATSHPPRSCNHHRASNLSCSRRNRSLSGPLLKGSFKDWKVDSEQRERFLGTEDVWERGRERGDAAWRGAACRSLLGCVRVYRERAAGELPHRILVPCKYQREAAVLIVGEWREKTGIQGGGSQLHPGNATPNPAWGGHSPPLRCRGLPPATGLPRAQ